MPDIMLWKQAIKYLMLARWKNLVANPSELPCIFIATITVSLKLLGWLSILVMVPLFNNKVELIIEPVDSNYHLWLIWPVIMESNDIPFLFFFFCFLGPHPRNMEVSRLGVRSELQLLAYATALPTRDLSHICSLQHSSRQRWIFNPLSEARDEPETLWFLVGFVNPWATKGTPQMIFLRYASHRLWIPW